MIGEQNLVMEQVYPGSRPQAEAIPPAPRSGSGNQFFSEALLEQSTVRQKRSPKKWAIALLAHFGVLAALILMPLFLSQGLDMKRLETTLLVAPMPPMAAPPPMAAIPRAVHVAPRTFTPGKLTAPMFIPKSVPTATTDSTPPEEAFSGSMGGVTGGIPGGQIGGIIGGLANVSAPAVPVPAPVAEGPKKPVRVGGDVKPPRLLYGPAAIYPTLAAQSHVHGVVVIDAIIDEHGNVMQEKVVSGHPLLIQAAMKAVSQRKYEPTVLDGEPTPVDLRVEVNFLM